MTQADFTISNQTFPNTRTELNTSLQALATNSAGNSAPSTTFPNQWHFDSDGNVLYMRNKDNDAWVQILTIGATSDLQTITTDLISEVTSAAGVTVDGLLIKDGGFTATLGSTITTADNTDTLSLISTDADANVGPNLVFNRNSSSPADNDDLGKIVFKGRNDNSQDVVYAQIRSTIVDASDGTEDGLVKHDVSLGGTAYQHLSMGNGSIVFNEESQDIDFRVESNSYAHCLFVDGGNDRVGVGEDSDINGLFRVSLGDSGVTGVSANAQGIIIEDNANAGMTIATPNDAAASIFFADPQDNNVGEIQYNHSSNHLAFNVNATEALRISTSQVLSTGGETAPDTTNGGITIQTNGEDNAAFTLKNSDVAHGITGGGGYQTDTYAVMKKNSATNGGLRLQSASESAISFKHEAWATGENTAESISATSTWCVDARKKNGTSITGLAADDNLASFRTSDDAQFIIKGDGELFSNQSATVGTYDAYEDAQLVRAYDLNHMQGVINSKFDKFVQYNKDDLQKARLIGTDADGSATSMVNITGMQRLHNGAIWQQYEKTERLAKAVYELAKVAVGEDKANEILEQNEIKLLN